MSKMRIAVCVKPVPDPDYYSKITVDKKTKRLQRDIAPSVLNELDRHALEKALIIKEQEGAQILVFAMAPENTRETLLETLALGADEIVLLSDRAFGGADTLATAYTLSRGIEGRGDFDLILMGNESSDGGTNQVAAQLGELLKIPRFTNVVSLEWNKDAAAVKAKTDVGINSYNVTPPLLCGVCREIAEPRYAHFRAIKHCTEKPFTVLGTGDFACDENKVGDPGSPTRAGEVYEKEKKKEAVRIEGTPDEIVERILVEMKKAGVLDQGREVAK